MRVTSIDIDEVLRSKACRIEGLIQYLRQTQIVEAAEYAAPDRVARLRACVRRLDAAVAEIESWHPELAEEAGGWGEGEGVGFLGG